MNKLETGLKVVTYLLPVRLDYSKIAPDSYKAVMQMQNFVNKSTLPKKLLELIKIRASQINKCAYCLDMHAKDAKALGESDQRIYLLNAWRESPEFYTKKEQVALAWTEALTLISESVDRAHILKELKKQFSDKEIVDLTMAIVTINTWNRLSIGLGADVGSYKPRNHKDRR